uniref:RING-type domain-containing protein n=1 Tax=Anopheles dirus TaxID=7168 RepID=A0A182NTU9_9DIPT
MVLHALADFIYNVYLLLYYIFKTICFVGFLLCDTTYNAVRIVVWCLHNVHVFLNIVYEDNQQIIQNTKAFLLGTSDFFISNIAKVYGALCFAVATFGDALLAVWSLLGLTLWTVKHAIVLIGQAVWLLYTAPYQLLILLEELLKRETNLLIETAQQAFSKQVAALVDIVHYVAHDVPVEAACGLGLLVLTCYYPAPAKAALKFTNNTVHFGYRLLRRKTLHSVRRILTLLSTPRANHTVEQPEQREDTHRASREFHQKLHRFYARVMSFFVFNAPRRPAQNAREAPARSPPAGRAPNPPTIGTCIICEDNDRAVAFVPCGHLCVCKVCATHISHYNPVCPLCRTYIEKKLDVYV